MIEILDAYGEAVAKVGEVVGLSGGEKPRMTDFEGQLHEPIPEACAGPYWLMGESLFAFATVPVAELVANPSRYDGRNVCTAGAYANGFEVNALAASTYRGGEAVYLSEPAILLEGGSVLSRDDCFASTPVVEFCEVAACGAFQHGEGYGHLGGDEYQIMSAVPPAIAEAAATPLTSPPAANLPAPSANQSSTPGSVPNSGGARVSRRLALLRRGRAHRLEGGWCAWWLCRVRA